MNWQAIALDLPTGHKTRVLHCGDDAAATVRNQKDGISLHCYRCGEHLFESHGQRNFKELMEIRKRDKEAKLAIEQSFVRLPHDFTQDIPLEGRLWLYPAGITPYMARKAGFGWSPYFQRVILPVYADKELVYYQARAVMPGQDPKYLNPKVDKDKLFYRVAPADADNSLVVVVEDILSANRVGKFVPTVSLMGTKISTWQAEQLTRYDNVVTWLDPDKAGITGAKAIRSLTGLARPTFNITSELDPKLLSDKLIEEQLWQLQKQIHV